jgi:hypothetical protein
MCNFVNYSEYRNNIKNGDLLVWSPGKIRSFTDFYLKMVGVLLRTKYVHTGIALWTNDRLFSFEANIPTVKLALLSDKNNFYHIPLDLDWKDKYTEFAYKELGKRYDLIDLIKFLVGIRNDEDSWYCSELTAKFYRDIGVIDDYSYGITPHVLTEKIMELYSATPVYVNIDKMNLDE